jgi:hypothetical protein
MATSVKIDEATKDRLEQLQAEIKLETGTKVTQQELLDRIVAREFESKAELIDSYRDDWEGLSEAEIERWLSGTGAWGGGDDRDHDEMLYGDELVAKKLDEGEES